MEEKDQKNYVDPEERSNNKKAKKTYKDTVFRALFNDKDELLSLFNALNGTDYTDSNDVIINTLGSAVYLGMKNDVSCILYMHMQLYEQQATVNPNMPLRDFFYCAEQLAYEVRDKDIYSRKLIKIPTPKFFTFYNGKTEQPPVEEYRLSDSFKQKTEKPSLELIVTQININKGMNDDLVKKCPTLYGYVTFVARVSENKETMTLEDSIEKAMEDCISEGILKEFFEKNRKEVYAMSLYDFSVEKHEKFLKEEGRLEGREEGREELALRLVRDGIISLDEIARYIPTMASREYLE